MAKNYIQDGDRITYTNGTGSDISSGDPVVVGGLVCVALVNIADGSSGALAAEGVYELPKATGVIAQGEAPLFVIAAGNFAAAATTAAAGDISGSCVAWETAASDATVVRVKLNPAPGTVESGV